MRTFLKIAFVSIFVAACSGYRVANISNPLQEDGIHSISVPMFVNRSAFPNAAAPFTQEMIYMLSRYPGIKVVNGEDLKADAILIGILSSEKKLRNVYKTMTRTFTDGDLQTSIGNRPQFYIPTSTKYRIDVQMFLIKNPTKKEIELFQSENDLAPLITKHPKVIISRSEGLFGTFSRETKSLTDSDDGGAVNQTKTDYYFEQSLRGLAKGNAESFRQVVLDVF